jgi:cellulose synthase/poly-beta-1,6-N-acetylglucosamine synthase-like glycosyltransferase
MISGLNAILVILVFVFAYTWFGYPVLLALLARYSTPKRGRPRPVASPADTDLPHIHVIIAAYNEVDTIAARIRNLQALDYPNERLSVYLGTDGCTDATASTAQHAATGDARIHVFESAENRGKVAVLRDLISRVRSTDEALAPSLLVFSDANTMFAPDAVLNLARHFSDPDIGGVCGRLIFTSSDPEATTAERADENPAEEGLYWRLETKLKIWESELDSCLGANGGIYAIRPSLFWQSIPTNTIVDDFVIGMKVREQGYRMLYDPTAIALEKLPDVSDEWGRRVRIGAGDYQALRLCKACLNPRLGWFAWAFWSHKVLRWLTPHLAIMMACLSYPQLVIACGYGGQLISLAPALTVATLLSAILAAGQAGKRLRKVGRKRGRMARLCGACDHFVTMHTALFAGFVRFCGGNMSGAWKRTPRTSQADCESH